MLRSDRVISLPKTFLNRRTISSWDIAAHCSDFSCQSDGTVTCIAYPAERMKGTNFQAAAFSVSEVNNPKPPKVIEATKDYTQSHPRGLAYWEAVNELIQRESVEDRDRFFLAMLRDLGIKKGKPFTPDNHHKQLLEDAALLGEEIAKVVVYQKRFYAPTEAYFDRSWPLTDIEKVT